MFLQKESDGYLTRSRGFGKLVKNAFSKHRNNITVGLEIADFHGYLYLKYVCSFTWMPLSSWVSHIRYIWTRQQDEHGHKQQHYHHYQQPGFLLMSCSRSHLSKHGKRAEWLCCYWADTLQCIHTWNCIHADTWTHALSFSAVPRSSERGPSIGASLGTCAECSGSRLVFWFPRPVFKMTEIVQGLGKLPTPRWQIVLERTWDGLLMATFLSAKAVDHVRVHFSGSFRRYQPFVMNWPRLVKWSCSYGICRILWMLQEKRDFF